MTFYKDEDAVLDYMWDWSDWLAAESDTITSSTFIVPIGITKASDTHTGTTATVWLSGGTSQQSYFVTNRIVTSGGRTNDKTERIVVNDQ